MQIDIGYGDAVTPAPEIADYPILLEIFPAPRLRVYSRYTVIAEKLETMIFLGIANSRMKDYFDLWVLSQHADFDGTVLRQAIAATLIRRSTAAPAALPFALTTAFAADPSKRRQWEGFLNKNRLQAPALEQVVSELHGFLGPILESLSAETEFKRQWDGESGWRV